MATPYEVLGLLVLGLIIGSWATYIVISPKGPEVVVVQPPTPRSVIIGLSTIVSEAGGEPKDVCISMPLPVFMAITDVDIASSLATEESGIYAHFCGIKVKGLYPHDRSTDNSA